MSKASVTFANGDVLKLRDLDQLIPINKTERNGENFLSMGELFELYTHHNDGLARSIVEFVGINDFFFLLDQKDIIYKSSSIVKIENL